MIIEKVMEYYLDEHKHKFLRDTGKTRITLEPSEKRFIAACFAMAGICANPSSAFYPEDAVIEANKHADALLKELEKETP